MATDSDGLLVKLCNSSSISFLCVILRGIEDLCQDKGEGLKDARRALGEGDFPRFLGNPSSLSL